MLVIAIVKYDNGVQEKISREKNAGMRMENKKLTIDYRPKVDAIDGAADPCRLLGVAISEGATDPRREDSGAKVDGASEPCR